DPGLALPGGPAGVRPGHPERLPAGGLPRHTGRRTRHAPPLRARPVERARGRPRGPHRRRRGGDAVLPGARGLMDVLEADGVRLRPLRHRDRAAWHRVRAENADWLRPWEATSPVPGAPLGFAEYVAQSRRLARRGEALTYVIEVDGELVGQLSVSSIVLGSARSAAVGYWVSRHVAGRGIVPTAVALATDHCFTHLQLHR